MLIEAERGSFDLFEWMATQPDEEFRLAAITIAELRHGVERARFFQRILEVFEVVPYSGGTAIEHARLWAGLEGAGRAIGAHDMILAATALERGDAVATFNARHFAVVPGLRVIVP